MQRVVVLVIFIFSASVAFSQRDTFPPPYKRFPEYPPVKLLLPDSVSYFTKDDLKKRPTFLLLFNPQCEHCQHEIEELLKHIDAFKKIQIVMATSMPFDSMLVFRNKYNLAAHNNIIVGQDTHFFLYSFFQNRNVPFHAFFDKKKQLISVFEGNISIGSILNVFND